VRVSPIDGHRSTERDRETRPEMHGRGLLERDGRRGRYRANVASPVAHVHHRFTDGEADSVPAADIYKTAVEQYRFQAQFNWSRTQFLLTFNAAVLVAATVVASTSSHGALVFALGAVAVLLTVAVLRTQHDYYRAARNHLRLIEHTLQLPQHVRLEATSATGHRRSKLPGAPPSGRHRGG
jgi:Flp pilus assembly protein TadB